MKYFQSDYFSHEFESLFDGILTDIPYKGAITNKLNEEHFSFDLFMSKADSETKPNAFLITFTNFLCAADLIQASKKTHWKFKTYQIWDKRPIRSWISWGHPLRHTEYIVYFSKGDFKFNFRTGQESGPYKRNSFGGSLKSTTENTNKKSYQMYEEILTFKNSSHKIHPTEKPVQFSHYFAKIIGNKQSVILDPFMGSGNLLKAFPNATGLDIVNYNKNQTFLDV